MKKKITAVALVVALLAIALIGGSLAYFTDTADATNTFTMGKVDIDLTEPSWDEALGAAGKLKVFPGQTYDKDPTITVASDSEDCYLVATVTISNLADLQAIYANDTTGVKQAWGLSLAGNGKMVSGGVAALDVTAVQDTTVAGETLSGTMLGDVAFITYKEVDDTIVYTYYFKAIQKAGATQTLFEKVNIPSIIENGEIKTDLTVTVNAYAIQAVGFDDVYEAYAAYNTQETTT